jgi:hypothetical protein
MLTSRHLPMHLPPQGDWVTFWAAALFEVAGRQSWEVAPIEVAAHVHPREVATQALATQAH